MAPFDKPELRRAMGLAFDRKAFLEIFNEGRGLIGANMMPPADGAWGMPPEVLQTLPGYGPDVEKNRAEARKIMEKLGCGPDQRLAIKLSTRNFPDLRNYAVIMISHLKEIYIDAELRPDNGRRDSEQEVDRDDAISGNVRTGDAIARRCRCQPGIGPKTGRDS